MHSVQACYASPKQTIFVVLASASGPLATRSCSGRSDRTAGVLDLSRPLLVPSDQACV